MKKDFLDELIEERARKNPSFGRLLKEAEARRDLAKRLAAEWAVTAGGQAGRAQKGRRRQAG